MPRLLHNNHRLQPRSDRRRVRRMLSGALPAYRRQGEVDRRVQLQAEINWNGEKVVEIRRKRV